MQRAPDLLMGIQNGTPSTIIWSGGTQVISTHARLRWASPYQAPSVSWNPKRFYFRKGEMEWRLAESSLNKEGLGGKYHAKWRDFIFLKHGENRTSASEQHLTRRRCHTMLLERFRAVPHRKYNQIDPNRFLQSPLQSSTKQNMASHSAVATQAS